jgi:hypothetical protein
MLHHEHALRPLVLAPLSDKPPHKRTDHGIEIEIDLINLVEAYHKWMADGAGRHGGTGPADSGPDRHTGGVLIEIY